MLEGVLATGSVACELIDLQTNDLGSGVVYIAFASSDVDALPCRLDPVGDGGGGFSDICIYSVSSIFANSEGTSSHNDDRSIYYYLFCGIQSNPHCPGIPLLDTYCPRPLHGLSAYAELFTASPVILSCHYSR